MTWKSTRVLFLFTGSFPRDLHHSTVEHRTDSTLSMSASKAWKHACLRRIGNRAKTATGSFCKAVRKCERVRPGFSSPHDKEPPGSDRSLAVNVCGIMLTQAQLCRPSSEAGGLGMVGRAAGRSPGLVICCAPCGTPAPAQPRTRPPAGATAPAASCHRSAAEWTALQDRR